MGCPGTAGPGAPFRAVPGAAVETPERGRRPGNVPRGRRAGRRASVWDTRKRGRAGSCGGQCDSRGERKRDHETDGRGRRRARGGCGRGSATSRPSGHWRREPAKGGKQDPRLCLRNAPEKREPGRPRPAVHRSLRCSLPEQPARGCSPGGADGPGRAASPPRPRRPAQPGFVCCGSRSARLSSPARVSS